MIILLLIVALIAASVYSHYKTNDFQKRLTNSDLSDPIVLNGLFTELVKSEFPLLFLGALPIAIITDFMPPFIRNVLNAKRNGKFKGCPLKALVMRLRFFNLVISSSNLVSFKEWLGKLAALHAKKGVSFSNENLARFHIGVLGGVLTAVQTLAPYLAWRQLTDREYILIHAWLANIAANLGITTFPTTLEALRNELKGYEHDFYAHNPKESQVEAKKLLVTMTIGITRLVPFIGNSLRPLVEVLLTAAMSTAYRTGFGLKLSLITKILLVIALLPIRALLVLFGAAFPYIVPVNFGHIVRYAAGRAEAPLAAPCSE